MNKGLRVLIADDQEYFRVWLKELLFANFPEITAVEETSQIADLPSKAATSKAEVIFLDIEFRDQAMHGIAAAELIWKANPNVTIVICSAHKEEVYVKKLFKIVPPETNYGYILKDQSVGRFVDAGKAIFSSQSWIDPEVYKIFKRPADRNVDLTDSEYETIVLTALGLGDRACAELLYIGEKAVQARLSNVYSKLGLPARGGPDAGTLNNRCRAVWVALQRGLIDEVDLRQHETEILKLANVRGMKLPF
jgi:DNA-binding NarL/FixJ family response regulator